MPDESKLAPPDNRFDFRAYHAPPLTLQEQLDDAVLAEALAQISDGEPLAEVVIQMKRLLACMQGIAQEAGKETEAISHTYVAEVFSRLCAHLQVLITFAESGK